MRLLPESPLSSSSFSSSPELSSLDVPAVSVPYVNMKKGQVRAKEKCTLYFQLLMSKTSCEEKKNGLAVVARGCRLPELLLSISAGSSAKSLESTVKIVTQQAPNVPSGLCAFPSH